MLDLPAGFGCFNARRQKRLGVGLAVYVPDRLFRQGGDVYILVHGNNLLNLDYSIQKFLRVVVMAPHFQGGINGQKLHVGPSSLGHYALSLYFYLIVVHVGKPVDH